MSDLRNVHVVVHTLDAGILSIDITQAELSAAGWLRSGRVYSAQHRVSDVQTRDMLIRPYYRRRSQATDQPSITIFATEVKPMEVY